MKLLSANLLATIAVLLAGGNAFGQVQQTGHRAFNGYSGGFVGYQACNWCDCQGNMYAANCDPCFANGRSRGGQLGRCSHCPGGLCAGSCWTRSCLGNTCLGRCCATKAFPDSGWAPPVRLPVNYDNAWYAAYHPQAFYGNPGGGFIANYPVVYQPTDTAQMGYYYHNVPTWQTRDDMIPPVPQPSDYHARMCLGGACNNCPCNYSGMAAGPVCQPTYQPHYAQVVRPQPKAAAQVSFSKRLFGKFDAVSLSRILD